LPVLTGARSILMSAQTLSSIAIDVVEQYHRAGRDPMARG
jgi:hypothetical protein